MQNGSQRSRLVAWAIGLTALVAIATVGSRAQVTQQVLLQESFRGPDSASAVVTLDVNAPGFPCLTADPTTSTGNSTVPNCDLASPDPVGSGALRFTSTTEQQASGFVADTSLPTSQGLEISFTQYQYGGYGLGGPGEPGGADGISFFMAVAPPSPQAIGQQGGALGYASSGTASGLPGAWLGVGLDAFGNFSNAAFGSPSCPAKSWAGFNPDSVTVRGPGHGTNGYCLLASSADQTSSASLGGFGLSTVVYAAGLGSGLSLRGADRASSARDITIRITPADGLFRVYIDDGTGPTLATSGALPTSYYDPVTGALVSGLPPRITFGFSASTGSATDIHEISDLTATTTSGAVPILGLTKTASSSSVSPGQAFTYVITPRVVGPVAEPKPLTVRVTDDVPAGVVLNATPFGTSWSCTPTSPTAFKCVYTNATSIAAGTTLPGITVPVIVDSGVPNGTAITNTATVLSDDAAGPVEAMASVTVAAVPPLVITTTTLPGGTASAAYSATLLATGGTGTRTWSLATGSLPAGLTLSAAGAISGTPTASGTASFTVRVTDQAGATTTKALSIAIATAVQPLVITTTTLPGGTVSTAYSATLVATGGTGTRTWSLATGALPAGVTLSTAGAISGTPTASGTASFTVRVTDVTAATTTRTLSIAVAPAASPLVITTTTLPGGTVGTVYAAALAATGGTGTRTWSIASGALPASLTLSATGAISGTPTASGTASVTVRVTDAAAATTTRALSIVVATAVTPLAITTTALSPGEVGLTYAQTLAATGGRTPYVWSVQAGGLPIGLALSRGGAITGIPQTAGAVAFTVRVTDAQGRVASRSLFMPVRERLQIVTTSLPDARLGVPYRAVLHHSGGLPPVSWRIVSPGNGIGLPPGLTLSTDGVISGTPTASGTFIVFAIVATDALGVSDDQRLTLTVQHPQKAYFAEADFGCPYACDQYVTVVDTRTGTSKRILVSPDVFRDSPSELAASPDGSRVFVATSSITGPRLHEIDVATDSVVWSGAANQPRGAMVFSADSKTLYYTSIANGRYELAALDLSTHTERMLNDVWPSSLLLPSSDGTRIYGVHGLSTYGAETRLASIDTYDAASGALIRTLPLGSSFIRGAALTPNGGRLFVSVQTPAGQAALLDISTASNAVADTILTSAAAQSLESPNNVRLWSTSRGQGTISEYSLVTNRLIRTYTIPGAAGSDVLLRDNPSQAGGYARAGNTGAGTAVRLWRFEPNGTVTSIATVTPPSGTGIAFFGFAIAKGFN